jgi:hypothetical protein
MWGKTLCVVSMAFTMGFSTSLFSNGDPVTDIEMNVPLGNS